ncbi:TPA: hypothetical protein QC443_002507 [Bacillus cereus]|uniref:hypothetical protein n=1 Tax=Bacillus paranthracis TaxID=2026186 RepID=UPI00296A6963|nr:hypothetical protein [Bacillus paranthracis]HDR8058674.1 hypothetical protein [Bacillus cereus]MED1138876.1 hypothetical protein [Bacillus paranthracis]HDR8076359.1 hypothetical protein [Bacillus cereus]HDR8207944.1 hypothetical protein [Bacillus cereus]
MTNKICKLYRLERRQVFMKIIEQMLKAGWKQLNENAPTKNKIYVMYSNGNDGGKNNYIELRPFDSQRDNTFIMTATADTVDIRQQSNTAADGSYRLVYGYDEKSGTGLNEGNTSFQPLVFHQGKAAYDRNPTNIIHPSYMVDLYLYVDKETVLYCVYVNDENIPADIGKTTIGFLGLPSEYYQPELFAPYSHPFTVMMSASVNSANTSMIANRSQFGTKSNSAISMQVFYWDKAFLKAPTLDGKIIMTPLFAGDSSEGLRFKYDGFYVYKGSNFVYGDILEVITNGETQRYKLFYTYFPGVISSFSEFAVALRIE